MGKGLTQARINWAKRRYQRIKNDPVKHEKYKKYHRDYWRKRKEKV